ncbi:hypothetical protein ACP275_08G043200 [Erythranthe tilingii]
MKMFQILAGAESRKTDYDTKEETLRKLEEKQKQKTKTIERDDERRSKPLKKKYYNPNQMPNPIPNPMPDPVPNPMPDPVPNPTPDLSPENGYSQIAVKWIQFDSSRLLDVVEQADGANLVLKYMEVNLTNVIYSQFEGDISRRIKDILFQIRQYRAPELMLAAPYSNAVDIRAVGCIFAEMVKRKPIFCVLITGKDVMKEIISLFGLPEESEWQGAETYIFDFFGDDKFPAEATKELASSVVPGLEPEGLDLLLKMLCIDLHERISVKTVVTEQQIETDT